jgi:hypothetical protein
MFLSNLYGRLICLTFMAIFATSIAIDKALAADENIVVPHSDGTYARYLLRPVHNDPRHAAVVEERLHQLEPLNSTLPSAHEIPAAAQTQILDQGQRGTCVYFATSELVEAYYKKLSPSHKETRMSEECLVDVRNWMWDQGAAYKGSDKPTVRPDPDGDEPNLVIQTIEKNGIPESRKFSSYDCRYWQTSNDSISLNNYNRLFTPAGGGATAYAKGLKFDKNAKPSIEAIKALIASDIPVEVAILVYNSFMYKWDWDYDGSCHDKDIAGGHAVILTGYKTESNGRVRFKFKNSWGSWGYSGYGTLDDRLLIKSWGYDPSFDEVDSLH